MTVSLLKNGDKQTLESAALEMDLLWFVRVGKGQQVNFYGTLLATRQFNVHLVFREKQNK